MTKLHKILVAIILSTLAGVAMAEFGHSDCVNWSTESFPTGWGFYNHMVHLESDCEETMRCDVSTSTEDNSALQTVELRAEEKRSITTAVGSRWPAFETTVECAEVDDY